MLNLFKLTLDIPYEHSERPASVLDAHDAISAYCEKNGEEYSFISDDEVVINGKEYVIKRNICCRGNYFINCRRK